MKETKRELSKKENENLNLNEVVLLFIFISIKYRRQYGLTSFQIMGQKKPPRFEYLDTSDEKYVTRLAILWLIDKLY